VQHVAHIAPDEDAVVDIGLAKLEVEIALQVAQVSRDPVMKLSSASTFRSRREQRLAEVRTDESSPPLRRLWVYSGQCREGEAQAFHRRRIVDVSAVDDHGAAHQLLDSRHVELSKLIPFRDKDERVRPSGTS